LEIKNTKYNKKLKKANSSLTTIKNTKNNKALSKTPKT
jgi:hypothetical protein